MPEYLHYSAEGNIYTGLEDGSHINSDDFSKNFSIYNKREVNKDKEFDKGPSDDDPYAPNAISDYLIGDDDIGRNESSFYRVMHDNQSSIKDDFD
ncbi:MAG: hypothetical protein WBP08_12365 [Saprospiraceae bacterium]|nr:hypothetical protein [Saprospiraceae bacterium]